MNSRGKDRIAEYISDATGLKENQWMSNKDMEYLYICAKKYADDSYKYASHIFGLVSNRIENNITKEELLQCLVRLVGLSSKARSPEDEILAAQAIEIVANDYLLLGKMSDRGAPLEAILELKSNIIQDALDVSRRLLSNAARKLQSNLALSKELDKAAIKPLRAQFMRPGNNGHLLSLNGISRLHLIVNAGRSTRLRTTIPKGVLYLQNKPMIKHVIEAGRKSGYHETYVVLGFKKEVNSYFMPEEVKLIEQEKVLGTGHAVICARDRLREFKGTLLVSYSDMPFITPATLTNLTRKHEESDVLMTLLTTSSIRRPEFGRLVRNDQGNVIRIKQTRVREISSDQVDAGFYCFKCPEIWEYLENITNDNNRYEYYLTDIIEVLSMNSMRVDGYETNDERETLGINRPNELVIAEFLSRKRVIQNRVRSQYPDISDEYVEIIAKLAFYYEYGGIGEEQFISKYETIQEAKDDMIKLVKRYDKILQDNQGAIFTLNQLNLSTA